jgi:hypothetical protein
VKRARGKRNNPTAPGADCGKQHESEQDAGEAENRDERVSALILDALVRRGASGGDEAGRDRPGDEGDGRYPFDNSEHADPIIGAAGVTLDDVAPHRPPEKGAVFVSGCESA